ncbi:decaprenyl-phosphate phosphoribosyltransferase [Confluentibacter sediminis]|uniref:decaprenyl-phosphate phosphoribosyltransferase n=1 Tax=Confluentibacter sediminis TaxID=2219045 RepID=UPI000DACF32B|nr:decaprenyl-phosphate phosphoribosyltransferase [Confluentibacter sediminis]
MKLKYTIQLIRPEQWVKNTFIFLPLFFSGQMLHIDLLVQTTVAFFAFSAAASSIYCFNDIYDVEADRLHPKKCKRPIASNKVSIKTAYVVMMFCLLLSMLILYFFAGNQRYMLMALIGFYFCMNIAYCMKLKSYPIIDVLIVSIGFVLRIIVGGKATNIMLSEWIVIMTFLIALFLAFAKRRDDVILYNNSGVIHRKNILRYNIDFLNQVITVISTIIIIAYIMYSISPNVIEQFKSRYVYTTTFFVLTGIIRYLQVTIVDTKSGNPTKVLLKDRFIQACIVGWIIMFSFIIYL